MMKMRRNALKPRHLRNTQTFSKRSPIEDSISEQLKNLGIENVYELGRIPYEKKMAHYTPDFILPNGIIVEVKGFPFESGDRTKHLLLKEQYPALDQRFVFQNPAIRLNKTSKTSYGDWCDRHGFLYAERWIPDAWIKEAADAQRIATLKEVLILIKHERH